MSQGGVIGKSNEPTLDGASGLWRLEELFRARLGANWPVIAALIDTIYRGAKNDVAGDVFAYNPIGFIDPAFADQTAGLLAEVEVFHYSLATFPAGLTVTSSLSLGEDADKPERVTALVVDGPLTLEAEIGVTNGRSRLAFVVLSRDDIDVGDGRNIVQPPFTYVEQPGATEDYRPYTLSKFTPGSTRFLKEGGGGGRGGASAPGNPGGRGGSGGVAFGGSPAPPWPRSATGTAGAAGQQGPNPGRGGGGGGGGSPAGSAGPPGGSGGSLPAGGTLIVAGNAVTIPPTGTITAAGGAGAAGAAVGAAAPFGPVSRGGGGGGAGGHPITIFHAGAFVNNGTITAAGGSGGPGPGGASPGSSGGAGEITVEPVPTLMLNQ